MSTPTPAEIQALSPYHYIPTEWVCALFISLFGLSGLLHVAEATFHRIWWLFPTAVLSALIEIIGWSGRLWSSKNLWNGNPFLMQITTTIIAPTPLLAANFIIFGRIIEWMGPQYSRLSPRRYTLIFTSCDVIALVVQAAGGGIASGSSDNGAVTGGRIMEGGIAFQLVAICVFIIFGVEYFWRQMTDRPVRQVRLFGRSSPSDIVSEDRRQSFKGVANDRKLLLMIFGLGFSTLCIFIRSVYRLIELGDGWNGRIMSTQVYFNVLDGGMITLATFTLNMLHPGFLLRPSEEHILKESQ